MKKKVLFELVLAAMFIAMRVVLERFLSFNTWNQRIGFSFIAVALSAVLLGVPWTMAVAGLGDIIGALLFPQGAYFPGFTLTALLIGACTGYFLHYKPKPFWIVVSILINQIFFSVLLNSLWISILYGSPYWASIPTRLIQAALMTAIQIIVDLLMFSEKSEIRKRLIKAADIK